MSEQKTNVLGYPSADAVAVIEKAFFHPETIFCTVMDATNLHEPATLDALIKMFPPNLMREFDLFLLLAECMANAVSYNNIRALGVSARRRGKMLLVSVFHSPSISSSVDPIIRNAHDGWLPDYDKDPPNGLGFPILFRLAYQITISLDRTRLQLWIRLRNGAILGENADPLLID
ncbi:MAG: hypothetical protein PHX43_03295 [Alphaproteobacteria bacterium]|nr:hypothetical protein [Alphaproteobacteria bacterium]